MSPLSTPDLTARLYAVRSEIRRLGVRRLGLFGSYSRGQQSPDSDVDLLVEFEPGQKSFTHFTALADLLEVTLDRRVDLVTRESLSPYVGPRILREVRDVPV